MNSSINNNKSLTLPDIFIAGSLFLFIVWESLIGFVLHFDAAARIPYTLIYLSLPLAICCCNGLQLLSRSILPISACFVWMLYSIGNVCLRCDSVVGFDSKPYFIWLFIGKFVFMLLLLIMLQRHKRFTLTVLSLALMVIVVLFLSYAEKRVVSAEGHERLYAVNVINPNLVAFYSVILQILAFYWLLSNSLLRLFGLICGAFAAVAIFLAVSRTAAATAIIIVSITGYIYLLHKKISNTLRISLLIFGGLAMWLFFTFSDTINDSSLAHRFNYRSNEIELFQLEDNLLTRILGERSVYCYEGAEIFKRDPIIGIGYNNYILFSRYKLRCHIEYVAQFVEGGIIGATLYLLFLLSICLPLLRIQKSSFEQQFFYFCGILALMLFGVGSYTSMKDGFYILCALILYSKLQNPDSSLEKADTPKITPDNSYGEAQ